ncbi:MAG: hypothetical protein HY587_07355 [Candidatus Omnitrophica bacterium]|nr:hypothetical protein [Candidatus Omnitrophota bacterium]
MRKAAAAVLLFMLSVAASPDLGVDRVTVNHIPAPMLGEVQLTDRDLIAGRIQFSGFTDASEIEYLLSAGKTWETAVVTDSRFTFEFDPGEGSRDFTVLIRRGAGAANYAVVIRFQNRRLYEIFQSLFDEIRDVYTDERLSQFLGYFDKENYDNFVLFQERMEDTFDLNAALNLQIQIAEIEVKDDVALLRVDFRKRWDDASQRRGANNIVRFRKVDGRWLITDIEDEALYIIGAGTFRGNLTDR